MSVLHLYNTQNETASHGIVFHCILPRSMGLDVFSLCCGDSKESKEQCNETP